MKTGKSATSSTVLDKDTVISERRLVGLVYFWAGNTRFPLLM